jgi:Leucine-rich repeat (LRR) protein
MFIRRGPDTELFRRSNRIGVEGIRHLKAFPNLHELDLNNTKIADECVEELGALSKLKKLNLSYTNTPANDWQDFELFFRIPR